MKIFAFTSALVLGRFLIVANGGTLAVKPVALPSRNLTAPATLPVALSSHTIPFVVPGTSTTLTFSNYGALISQTELDLCLIEGLAAILSIVSSLATKTEESFLPTHKFKQSYGRVEVLLQDYSAPAFRMTYKVVADVLRGIGLFMSLYGWFEVRVEVFVKGTGYVGVGRIGKGVRDGNADEV